MTVNDDITVNSTIESTTSAVTLTAANTTAGVASSVDINANVVGDDVTVNATDTTGADDSTITIGGSANTEGGFDLNASSTAGNSIITFDGSVNAVDTITADAADVTVSGDITTTSQGSVDLAATDALDIDNAIVAADAIDLDGDTTFTLANNLTAEDDVDLNDDVTLDGVAANEESIITSVDGDITFLETITAAAAGTQDLEVNATDGTVLFDLDGDTTFTLANNLTAEDDVDLNDDVTLDGVAANEESIITSVDGDITFLETITAAAAGTQDLEVNATDGTVLFDAGAGTGGGEMGDIDVNAARAQLGGNISTDSGTVDFRDTPLVVLLDLDLTAGTVDTVTIDTEAGNDSSAGSVLFSLNGNVDGTVDGFQALVINTNIDNVGAFTGGAVSLGTVGAITGLNRIEVSSANENAAGGGNGTITLGGDIVTSGVSAAITVDMQTDAEVDAIVLAADVEIDTANTGIELGTDDLDTISGDFDLILDAGSGATADVEIGDVDVNFLQVIAAGTGLTTLYGDIDTDEGLDLGAARDIELDGDLTTVTARTFTFTNTENGEVDLSGGAIDAADGSSLTVAANATNVLLGAVGLEGVTGFADALQSSTFGAMTVSSTGRTTLLGDISTSGGETKVGAADGARLDFSGARNVILGADVLINTSQEEDNDSGDATGEGADIIFASAPTAENSMSGQFNLTLDAGFFGDVTLDNVTELMAFTVDEVDPAVPAADLPGANSVTINGTLAIPGIVMIDAINSVSIDNSVIDDDVDISAAFFTTSEGIVVTGDHSITIVATGIGDVDSDGTTGDVDDIHGGDITIGHLVASTTGTITLTADDDVVFGAGGQVRTLGTVTITTDSGADEDGRSIIDTSGDTNTKIVGGTIDLNVDRNGFIASGTNPSGGGTGAVAVDGNADLEIDAIDSLNAVATGTGDITIRDVNNFPVDLVNSDTGDVSLDSGGAVNDANIDGDNNDTVITGGNIDLDAETGIGDSAPIELAIVNTATDTISADSTSGDINLIHTAPANTDITATSLTTGIGNIDFDQTGDVDLIVQKSTTTDGDIAIDNTGAVSTDVLQVTTSGITAGGDGSVTLTTNTAGDIDIDATVTALGDRVTLDAANGITLVNSAIDATGGTADLDANDGAIEGPGAGDGVVEITAADIILEASAAIGATGTLETTTTSSSITFAAGTSYNNTNITTVDTTLEGTAGTTITFVQNDGVASADDTGDLEILSIQSGTSAAGAAATITVTVDEADLIAREVVAGDDAADAGDITLTTTNADTTGDDTGTKNIDLGVVTAVDNTVFVISFDSIFNSSGLPNIAQGTDVADLDASNGRINGVIIDVDGGNPLDSLTAPATFDVRLIATDDDASGDGRIEGVEIDATGGIFAEANDGFRGGRMESSGGTTGDSVVVIATTGNIEDLDITAAATGSGAAGTLDTASMTATTGNILDSTVTSTGTASRAVMNATAGTIFGGNVIGSDNIDVDAGTDILGLQTSSVDTALIDAGNDILDSIFSASSLNPAEGIITIVNFNDFAGNTITSTGGDVTVDGSVFVVGNAFRVTGDIGIGTDPGGVVGFPVGFVTGNEIDGDADVTITADGDISGGTINTSDAVTLTTSAGLGGDINGISIASVGGTGDVILNADDNITGNEIQAAAGVSLDATEGDISGGTVDAIGVVTVKVDQGNIDGILINGSNTVTLDADSAEDATNSSNIRNVEATGTVITADAEADIVNTTLTSTTGTVTVTARRGGASDGDITKLSVLSAAAATVNAENGAVNDSDITGTSVDLDADSIEGGSVLATTTSAVVDTRDNGDIVNLEVTAPLGLADVSADGSIDGAIVRADDTDIDGDNIFNGSVTVLGTDAFDDAELDATSGDINGVTVVSANTVNLNANTGNIVNNNIQAAERINLGTDLTTVNVTGNSIEGDTDGDGGVIDIDATTNVTGNIINNNDTSATSVVADGRNLSGNVVTSDGSVTLDANDNPVTGIADITGNTVDAAGAITLESDVDITGGTYRAGTTATLTATAGDVDGVTVNSGDTATVTGTDILNGTVTMLGAASLVDIQATAGSVSGMTISSANDVEIDATVDVVNSSIDAADAVTIDTGAGTVVNVSNVDIQATGNIDVNAIGDLDGSSLVSFATVTADANDITDSGASGVDVTVKAVTQGADVADITDLTVETTGTGAGDNATIEADGNINVLTVTSATDADVDADVDIASLSIVAVSTTVDAGVGGAGDIAGGTIQVSGNANIDTKGDVTGLVIEAGSLDFGTDGNTIDAVGVEANVVAAIDLDLTGDVEGSIFVSATSTNTVDVNDIRDSGFTGTSFALTATGDIIGGEATATATTAVVTATGLINGINVDANTTADITSTSFDITDVGVTANGDVTLEAKGTPTAGDITGSNIVTSGRVELTATFGITGNSIDKDTTDDGVGATDADVVLTGEFITGNIIQTNDSVLIDANDPIAGAGLAFATGNIIDADFAVEINSEGEITGGTINAGDDVMLTTGTGGTLGNNITGISISGRRNVTVDSGESIIDVSLDGQAVVVTADETISGSTVQSLTTAAITADDDGDGVGDIDGLVVTAEDAITATTGATGGSISNSSFTSQELTVALTANLDISATDVSALTTITADVGRDVIDGSFLSEDAGIDFDVTGGSIIGSTFATLDISADSTDSVVLDAEQDVNGITVDADGDVIIGFDGGAAGAAGDITDTDNILGVTINAAENVDFDANVSIQGGNVFADGTGDFTATTGDVDGITITTGGTATLTGTDLINATVTMLSGTGNVDLQATAGSISGLLVNSANSAELDATADVTNTSVDATGAVTIDTGAGTVINVSNVDVQADGAIDVNAIGDMDGTSLIGFSTVTVDANDIVDSGASGVDVTVKAVTQAADVADITNLTVESTGTGAGENSTIETDGNINVLTVTSATDADVDADVDIASLSIVAVSTTVDAGVTGAGDIAGGTIQVSGNANIDTKGDVTGLVIESGTLDFGTDGNTIDAVGVEANVVGAIDLDLIGDVEGSIFVSATSTNTVDVNDIRDSGFTGTSFALTASGDIVGGEATATTTTAVITATGLINGINVDANTTADLTSTGADITDVGVTANGNVTLTATGGGAFTVGDIVGSNILTAGDVLLSATFGVTGNTIDKDGTDDGVGVTDPDVTLKGEFITGNIIQTNDSVLIDANDPIAGIGIAFATGNIIDADFAVEINSEGEITGGTINAGDNVDLITGTGGTQGNDITGISVSSRRDVLVDSGENIVGVVIDGRSVVFDADVSVSGGVIFSGTTATITADQDLIGGGDIDGLIVTAVNEIIAVTQDGSINNADFTSTSANIDLDASIDFVATNANAETTVTVDAGEGIIDGSYTSNTSTVTLTATASDIDGATVNAASTAKVTATAGSVANADITSTGADVDLDAGTDITSTNVSALTDISVLADQSIIEGTYFAEEGLVDIDATNGNVDAIVIVTRNLDVNSPDTATVDVDAGSNIVGIAIDAIGDVTVNGAFLVANEILTENDVIVTATGTSTGNEIDSDATVTFTSQGDITGGSINASDDVTIESVSQSIIGTTISTPTVGNVAMTAEVDISGVEINAGQNAILTADTGDIIGGNINAGIEGAIGAVATLTASDGSIDGTLVTAVDTVTVTAGGGDIRNVNATSFEDNVIFQADEDISQSDIVAKTTAVLTADFDTTGDGDIVGGSVDVKGEGTVSADITLTAVNIDDIVARTDADDLITATALPSGAAAAAINGATFAADTVTLTADTGVGNTDEVSVEGTEAITIDNRTGNVFAESTNNNLTALTITNGDAGGDSGNVVFTHNGSGVLTVTNITTIDGSVTVTSEPTTNVTLITAGGADSDIFINVLTGKLDFEVITAVDDRVEMNVFGDVTGDTVGVDLVTSTDLETNAGGNVNILTDITNFEGIIDGTLTILETSLINLIDVATDGTVLVRTTDGDITATRLITSDDDVTLIALDTNNSAGTSDDIVINGLIDAGTAKVTLTADGDDAVGKITGGEDADLLPDVIASEVDLDAAGRIVLDLSAQTIDADQGLAGAAATEDIILNNTSVIPVTATLNAAGTTGSDITLDQFGGGNLTIASVIAAEGNISSTLDDGDLTATIVTAGGAGDVTLTTTGNGGMIIGVITAEDDEVTLTAVDSITEATNDATENIIADTFDIDGGTNVGTAASPIDTTIDVLQIADVIGPVTLVETGNTTGTNVASINTEDVTVGSLVNVGGDFSLTATTGDIEASSITALEDTVTLIAPEGAIFETNAADADIAAGTLVMIAQDGIGSATALDTSVDTLDAQNLDGTGAAAGNIQINETDAIAIDRILQNAVDGTVSVIANAGSITLNEDQSGVVAETGQVDLDARGAESSITANDGVTTSSGNINIVADDDVLFGAEGDVTSTSGNVVVTADDDTTGAPFGGEIFMADVDGDSAVINAGTGTITMTANEDITLGSVVTNSAAGGDEIVIDSTSGEVLDGGDSAVDIVMAVAAAEIQIDAEEGIGSGASGALEMSGIDTIEADATTGAIALSNVADEAVTVNSITTGGGNISYVQTGDQALTLTTVTTTDGDVTISASGTAASVIDITTVSVDTTDDTVTITAGGAITATLAVANTEIVGATIDLTAGDGGIGTDGANAAGNSFDVNATVSFSADTDAGDDGDITVKDVAVDFPIGLVAAGAGTVTLKTIVGTIDDATADSTADIIADTAELDAFTGIGAGAALELASVETLDADTTTGDIDTDNVADAVVTVNSQTTTDGDITYDQTGAFGLRVGSITADLADDTVTITAEGGIDADADTATVAEIAAANIDLTTTADGIGTGVVSKVNTLEVNVTVSLRADTSTDGSNIFIDDILGNLLAELINAGDGDVVLTAEEAIEETLLADDAADIVGATVTLTANGGGIGATATIEVDVTTELDADSTTADGNIDLSDVAGGFPIGVVDADTGTVTLSSVGAVSDADADDALNVDASTLTIAAVSGIGNGDAIETTVDDVDLTNTPIAGADATANIEITELVAGVDLIITNAIQGDVGVEATNSGDVIITTEQGDLTVAAGGAVTSRDGGGVTLTAGDAGGAGSFDALIDGAVLSTVGLKDQGVGQVTPGTVTILADNDVRFSADGTVTVNQTLIDDTTQAPVTSLAGLVDIDATNGSILELNAGADADAEILAETIDLRAENGDIAQETTSSALEIDSGTATVNADVSDTDGVINITEVDGEMVVGVVDAGAGSVTLTATDAVDGAIVASDAATVEITADTIDLNAKTGIGTGANGALDMFSVVSLDADTTTGAIDLDVDADADVVVNSATTGAGSITVDQSGGDFDMTVETATTGDGDVTLTNAGGTSADIIVDTITADLVDDTVTLDVEGLIDAQNAAGAAEIAAANIDLIADKGGIGVFNGNLFEVNATVSFSADTRNDPAAITVTDIVGDLPIGLVQADTGTVTLESTLGEILDASADTATDIAADVVDLDAKTGVGGTATLELSSTITLDADVTGGAGSIGISNASDADVTVNSLTTPDGDITYAQTGANNDLLLGMVTADTDNDTVTLSAEGGIDLVAAADGATNVVGANISLTATAEGIGTGSGAGFGPVEVDATVSFSADTSADNGAILVTDLVGDLPLGLVTADEGLGTVADTGVIELTSVAGEILDATDDGITDIVGADVTLTAETGIGAT